MSIYVCWGAEKGGWPHSGEAIDSWGFLFSVYKFNSRCLSCLWGHYNFWLSRVSFLHYCKEIHGFKSSISGSSLCVSTWLSVKGILKKCMGLGNKIKVPGQVFGLVIETPVPHIEYVWYLAQAPDSSFLLMCILGDSGDSSNSWVPAAPRWDLDWILGSQV